MATSNPGPGVSANPNEMQLRSTYDINGKLLQILGPGQTVAYDPANVAITGGTVNGVSLQGSVPFNPADLAAPGGAVLVGFAQSGTGAAPITAQTKFRQIVAATDFFANGVSGALVDPSGVIQSNLGIQAAIDTLATTGGMVWLPPGTFLGNLVPHPVVSTYRCLLSVPSGVRLTGAGKYATNIKLADNQTVGIDTAGCSLIYNRQLTGGDSGVEVQDLTVDGNGVNQTKLHNGITFTRTRSSRCTRVMVKNVKGTTNFPPNETFHFETQLGVDTSFISCDAVGTSGTQGSGFSADNCTNVSWIDCLGRGMSAGHGFTCYQVINPSWTDCRAYLNGNHGFNCEESQSPLWVNCHSGGKTAIGVTPSPYAAGTSLGNGVTGSGSGFVVNGSNRASLVNCSSSKNQGAGLVCIEGSATYGPCSGTVTGGDFSENSFAGISFSNSATSARWSLIKPMLLGNLTTALDLPTGYVINYPGAAYIPAIPASATAVTNQNPGVVDVYINGGVGTLVQINGANVNGTLAGLYRLNPSDQIKIFYSTAPTWTWYYT